MRCFGRLAASVVIPVFLSACAGMEAPPSPDDLDSDGVVNSLDKCPDTVKVARLTVDADGCPAQTDQDGVPDYLDRCPGTPANTEVDVHGCPGDEDGDRVFDYNDRCPGTPAGKEVDRHGCAAGQESVIQNVNFDFNKSAIRADAAAQLDRAAAFFKGGGDPELTIVGHTDSVGEEKINQVLSEQRAEAVKKYLASQGVDTSQMATAGKGMSEPLVSNDTPSGRAVNRRAEFVSD